MAEPQLERSVLEGKERDELVTIATALGIEPGPRSKKADVVSAILVATGVEEAPEEKPKRTRAKKAAPAPVEADPLPLDTTPEESAAAEPEARASAAEDETPEEAEAADEPAAETAEEVEAAAPAAARPADEEAPAPAEGAPPARAAEPPRPNQSFGVGRPGGPLVQARSDLNRSQPQSQPQDNRPQNNPPQQGGGQGGNPQGGQNQGGGNPQGGQNQGGQQNQGGNQQGFGDEAGNRRNRRRRGRDRAEREEPRDFQPTGADIQYSGDPIEVSGHLDLRDEGFGFVRTGGLLPGPNDVYVSISQVRRFALRKGDHIVGASRPAAPQEKYPALLRIDTVSGMSPDDARNRPRFDELTPVFPNEKFDLELADDPHNLTARIVDLVAPIGKGQRGLVVSPPRAGKTAVVQQIARSIEANHPDVQLIVVLVDERPEDVTDMRSVVEQGDVYASTFDRPADEHTQTAEMAIERAKRLVELGQDVVVLLDGVTRLARAYNQTVAPSGRSLAGGGIDAAALYPPKRFLGAARNIEEGGSLTVVATALVETGSKVDEVIFEEFAGTANMELRLDRRLAERRLYPAVDVDGSSTRHEELLFDEAGLASVSKLRREIGGLPADEKIVAPGLELLIDKIRSTKTNGEFLAQIAKGQ